MTYDEHTRRLKGELPECPCLNLETLEIEYVDFNEESPKTQILRPLSDFYA